MPTTAAPTPGPIPLCVDLDGTLVRTDMLHESAMLLLRTAPIAFARTTARLFQGKAATKHWIADRIRFEAAHLPYRRDVLALIDEARAEGRPIVLATAAAPQIASAIADHLGVFDEVLSSDAATNLSAEAKAARLVERFGEGGFDYVGNDYADLPVWRHARRVIVASNDGRLHRRAAAGRDAVDRLATDGSAWAAYALALRPHQWLKNLLVFVPLLAAQQITNMDLLTRATLAFVAICAAASFGYGVNDLLDLEADRRHARKRHRPFASGALSIAAGIRLAVLLLVAAIALCLVLPPVFAAVTGLYLAITLAYSIRLKQQVVLDVILLAGLYTIRIIAGAAATGIKPSFWLLAFSMFIFLSLAVVKRCTELRAAGTGEGGGDGDMLAGRGYTPADLPVLIGVGTGSGLVSVLVLALYVESQSTERLYPASVWLWLMPPTMLYWVTRLWMKTHRGEVHDDPVVFAARDPQSLAIAALFALIFTAAAKQLTFW
ncbi:UbiA family prenyltransferase [Sphingomonas sp. TZW2008]|uniref:UbiA family prenyltransferase n=1 Tax=Sphingomonas sp. TZW2008 TaxID=1917973 RepID=UPI000A27012C|nr:UbiA family prenyltransferase [Sphingomonas sp. TZW2008]